MPQSVTANTCAGRRVLRLLALALELPGGFFEERFAAPIANVRAVHYLQGQPSNPEQGIFGVGAQPLSPLFPAHCPM